jgi:imidazolonepropionase-like amidohydrolase
VCGASYVGHAQPGFTTVRDTGGDDFRIKDAVEKGYLQGRRLCISERAIELTGGHSDMQRRTDIRRHCRCCDGFEFTTALADGVENVCAIVRGELRQGGANAIHPRELIGSK